ncbi:MAG: hypothetical protein AB1938_08115 [Myxococcota bacterium]
MREASQDEVSATIDRCAAVVQDLNALRDALHELRLSSDPRAQFATALFDLDRARRGDPEARTTMLQVADALLVFWREGTGDELAAGHPELTRLWSEADSLLHGFEEKRLARLLKACWDAREDAALLQVAVADLQPDGYRRVEFARCLYHLELARLFVQESRAEFSARAGLLSEAYHDEAVAKELIGGDAGLMHLWGELVPYLDEFFEHQERKAFLANANKVTGKLDAVPNHLVRTDPVATPLATPAAPNRNVPTQPHREAQPPAPEPLGVGPQVPSFRTLVGQRTGSLPPPPMTPPAGAPPAEDTSRLPTQRLAPVDPTSVTTPKEPALAVAPPPPPTDFTPPGAWKPPPMEEEADLVLDAELDAGPPAPQRAPPPPPRDLTPPGAWFPPSTPSGEVELVDAEEAPPPPPAFTPSQGLPAAAVDIDVDIEPEPDLPTLDFWAHTFEALQMAPGPDGRTAQRLFATETRGDRKRLVQYLDSLEPFMAVPEARAFACLIRLMLAAQTKEKGLFGQANPVRQEAVQAALSLLGASPIAAGHAAVWFELDGPETRAILNQGLDVLAKFLAFCSRGQVDPLSPAAVRRFAAGG